MTQFDTQNDERFTKTGSGQAWEKLRLKGTFLCRDALADAERGAVRGCDWSAAALPEPLREPFETRESTEG